MKKLNTYLIFLLLSAPFPAQVNTYYFNDVLPASQWQYNPALQSKEKLFVSVPALSGLHFQLGNTGFTYQEILTDNEVDIDKVLNTLEEENHVLEGFHTNLFGIGMKHGSLQWRLGLNAHFDARISYSKDLIEVLWKGSDNPDLLDRRLSMDGTAANAAAWLYYFVGASRSFMDDKLNLGLNLKYYQGIASSYTEQSTFGLYSDEDTYAITADGTFRQHFSGTDIITEDAETELYVPFSEKGNNGMGMDLGFLYSPNDLFTIEASVLDLGKINWKQGVKNYTLSGQEVSFTDMELDDFFSSPEAGSYTFEQLADSISDLFKLEESMDEFSTTMNTSYFVRGVCHLSERQDLSAFFADQNYGGKHFSSAGAMYSQELGKWLILNGGMQFFRLKEPMIPIGFIAQFGAVQFGVHTNNVLTLITPSRTKYGSGTFYLGLRFMREKRSATEKQSTEE
ncbi:MAG: hypothetical protein HKN39_06815 [Flavobacteriales bacterium]|nr:hypothetical protein [Flavobacteriales bacterium]